MFYRSFAINRKCLRLFRWPTNARNIGYSDDGCFPEFCFKILVMALVYGRLITEPVKSGQRNANCVPTPPPPMLDPSSLRNRVKYIQRSSILFVGIEDLLPHTSRERHFFPYGSCHRAQQKGLRSDRPLFEAKIFPPRPCVH